MKIEQIYTSCIAEAAYYIESNGEVAIIDPLRDPAPYLERAKKDGAKIKYIFETHFHADFVSGHLDLSKATGAPIIYGPSATAGFDIHVGKDGEDFKLGNITLRLIHTPGHTMESSSFLLIDENGKNHAMFTGDALFLGDVGRPDLAVSSDVTQEELARILFNTLRNKIMPLNDDLIIYPNHGAGSACGKHMSEETVGTLGNQKETNYALRADMTEDEFVKEVLHGILPPPQYFFKNAMMNKNGYQSFDEVLKHGNHAFDATMFEAMVGAKEAMILDVRTEQEFVKGHIPNSIFMGLNGELAPWAGALITDIKQPILLVTPKGQEKEAVTRLSRVGYDNTLGYLEGGFETWEKAGKNVEKVKCVSATDFAKSYDGKNVKVLDVRKTGEFQSEHVIGAENFPLDYINTNMDKVEASDAYHVHCAGGYRSTIAISILQARGFNNLTNIIEGFDGLKETEVQKSEFVCPTTL